MPLECKPRRGIAARTAEVLQVAHLGSWEWRLATNRVSWSDELYRVFGVDRASFGATYEAFLERVHPDDREQTDRVIRGAVEQRAPFVHWHRIVRPDGLVRVLQSSGDVGLDRAGRLERLLGTCLDITEAKRDTFELNRSLSLLRATLEATADGILVMDRDDGVVIHNARFLDMWRLGAEAMAAGPVARTLRTALQQLSHPESLIQRIRELREDPSASSYDTIDLADGRVFELYSRPQRIGDDVVGRVWSCRDVTDRRQAEAELDRLFDSERQARRAAEDAAQHARFLAEQAERALVMRDEFLSVASHELRGPLTSMRLAIQGLARTKVPDEERGRVLEILERQTGKLSDLVDGLLDVSRIRRGQLAMDVREVDLVAIVRQVVSRFDQELARTRTPLAVSAPPRAVGLWDPGRLDQVLTNLLSNALKFGQGRPVAVRVESHGGKVQLQVEDHGTGMSPELAAHVFEPFERGVSARDYGGLGLGLYIVARIVHGLGGQIRLRTSPGQGATFTVELPARDKAAAVAGPEADRRDG